MVAVWHPKCWLNSITPIYTMYRSWLLYNIYPNLAYLLSSLMRHWTNCSWWWLKLYSLVLGECKLSCLETLFVGSKPMVALSLAELPGNSGHMVLAMGGLDNKIHLYCGERTGKVTNSESKPTYFPAQNILCASQTCWFSFLMYPVCSCLRFESTYRLDQEFGLLIAHM